MINFIYFTDPHLKGKSPSTRTDDFPLTMEKKLRNLFEVGHKLNVDFFVCGGDFVDSPYTSQKYIARIGRIFKEGLKGKELFFVWGNHDMEAWNVNTIENTSLGLLEEFFDEMTLLKKEPIYRVYNEQTIGLSGVSSYANLDRPILDEEGNVIEHQSRDYVVEDTNGLPRIHVVHGFLSPKPILDTIHHTVVADMKHTKATITLTGHEHTGFSVMETDHGLVYNPGSLGRVFASHSEMNRMPKFTHCTIDDYGKPSINPIVSTVARPGVEVMDRSALDEKKLREQMLQETKGNIKEVLQTINIESLDLKTIVNRFEGEVRPEVFKEVNKRLGLL